MKLTSNERPKQIEKLGAKGVILINFDIEKTDEGFSYNQVCVSNSPTRNEIIEAIISVNYSIGNELANINNIRVDGVKYKKENDDYQAFRIKAKELADVVIKLI